MQTQKKVNKPQRYQRLIKQIEELLQKSPAPVSAMSTIAAVLFHKLPYFSWCGFYYLHNNELIVGPYQGPVACQVLAQHKGVCWAAIDSNRTVIVPDVEKFPGHIACDSRTKSEIVVPIANEKGEVIAVLDVDSRQLNSFDEDDKNGLEAIIKLIEPLHI
jgi:GAF domain-containing protein